MPKYKKEVIDALRTDPDLFTALTRQLGLKATSVATVISRNDRCLHQFDVVKMISVYLGREMEDLFEPEIESLPPTMKL